MFNEKREEGKINRRNLFFLFLLVNIFIECKRGKMYRKCHKSIKILCLYNLDYLTWLIINNLLLSLEINVSFFFRFSYKNKMTYKLVSKDDLVFKSISLEKQNCLEILSLLILNWKINYVSRQNVFHHFTFAKKKKRSHERIMSYLKINL